MKKSNLILHLPRTICNDGNESEKEGRSTSCERCTTRFEPRDDNENDSNDANNNDTNGMYYKTSNNMKMKLKRLVLISPIPSFTTLLLHYPDGVFVIHRKLLRRRHIFKERRERREEQQRINAHGYKRDFATVNMILDLDHRTKRTKLNDLSLSTSLENVEATNAATHCDTMWPRNKAGEEGSQDNSRMNDTQCLLKGKVGCRK